VQWGVGGLGRPSVEAILDGERGLELVGLRVYAADKAGVDVGTLIGRDPIGLLATDDPEEILALDADCVVYMPRTPSLDDVCALLASGKDVATPSFLFSPERIDPADRERLRAACATGGTTLHAAGINPGNLSGVLPLALSGMSRSIEKLTIQERGDWSFYESTDLTFEQQKFGRPVEEITPTTPGPALTSELFVNQVWMTADALGADIDEVVVSVDAVAAREDHDVFGRRLEAGTTVAQHWRWQGRKDGVTRVELETLWTVGEYPDHWPTPRDGWTITIEGDPSMQVHFISLASFVRNAEMHEHVRAANIAAAMQVLNAVPAVCAAGPGFATMADLPLVRNPRAFSRS
jgi:hypothetical protein